MMITVTRNPQSTRPSCCRRFVTGDTISVRSSGFDPGGKGINASRVGEWLVKVLPSASARAANFRLQGNVA